MGKRVMGIEVQGRRKRGRPKRKWLDSVNGDPREKGLLGEAVKDQVIWRRFTSHLEMKEKKIDVAGFNVNGR